jgi:hypothetical protein
MPEASKRCDCIEVTTPKKEFLWPKQLKTDVLIHSAPARFRRERSIAVRRVRIQRKAAATTIAATVRIRSARAQWQRNSC